MQKSKAGQISGLMLPRWPFEVTVTSDFREQPWPPVGNGWRIVRRIGGRTLWRRISSTSTDFRFRIAVPDAWITRGRHEA
jgi:hypothetical protein